MALQDDLGRIALENGFSGVAVVDRGEARMAEVVAGYANRAEERLIDVGTRFGAASATKSFTALAVASLIESGEMTLNSPLSTYIGTDLPLVDERVTIEHLLGHVSGVGDYLDEDQIDDIDDHVLGVPPHVLEGPEDYIPLMIRQAQVYRPGSHFSYNNSGYVMLALAAERAGGLSYHQLVRERVFGPAGMESTDFVRSDDLPAGTAIGYLENGRSNIFHLPVIGTGDGGAYTTAADMSAFWRAMYGGGIVSLDMVELLTAPRNTNPSGRRHYGLGFWVGQDRRTVMLEGMDAGVSFRSSHRPSTGTTDTVIANTSSGAWPLVTYLVDRLSEAGEG